MTEKMDNETENKVTESSVTEKQGNVTNKKDQKRLLFLLIIVIVVVIAAVVVVILTRPNSEALPDNGVPKLGYAEGTTVVKDSNALQEALDAMTTEDMMLEYEPDAFSADGENFSCYLANAVENKYDMYFDMYTDANFGEEIYLSGLLRPGTALEQIKLKRRFVAGDHKVVLAITTVEDDHQTVHGQTVVVYNLHVNSQGEFQTSSAE